MPRMIKKVEQLTQTTYRMEIHRALTPDVEALLAMYWRTEMCSDAKVLELYPLNDARTLWRVVTD